MKKMKARKASKIIMILLATLFMAALAVLLCLYFKFVHKESNIVLLKQENSAQEIFILGTVHEYHFNRFFDYSIVDIKNAIDKIQPDLVLLEVDPNTIDKYGVIKSPIEVIPLWCYAKKREIAVKGVDWFEVTGESRSWTTNKNRDDHIFDNVRVTKLK